MGKWQDPMLALQAVLEHKRWKVFRCYWNPILLFPSCVVGATAKQFSSLHYGFANRIQKHKMTTHSQPEQAAYSHL